ncbi:MAG: UvrD-helicase domain-containing protein, partial [Candidatus Acidiferrales bacterium]
MTQKEEAIPYQPTPEQRLILAHDRHLPARVLAGPGTGKSVTMVAFLNQLLEAEPQLRAKLITFTRAATAELARTVSDHANQTVQRPSTIHSFAISILLRNPGAGNFPKPLRIADDYEDSEIIRPTLARRINVHQTRLNALFREMASDWEFLEHRELPRIDNNDRIRFNAGWNQHRQVMGYTLLAELPFALRHALINHDNLQG